MSSLSLSTGDRLTAQRVMAFTPAQVVGQRAEELAGHNVAIRYQLKERGGTAARRLSGDPMAIRPTPVLRLLVNATSTFLVVLASGLVIAAVAPRLFGYNPVVVISGSMEPAIRAADVVVTAPSDGLELGEGAVINFDYDGTTRLHRVAEVTPQGYRTAGDANDVADTELVSPSQIRGVGVVVVPFVGLPANWLRNGQWPWLAVTVVVLSGAVYTSRSRWANHRNAAGLPA